MSIWDKIKKYRLILGGGIVLLFAIVVFVWIFFAHQSKAAVGNNIEFVEKIEECVRICSAVQTDVQQMKLSAELMAEQISNDIEKLSSGLAAMKISNEEKVPDEPEVEKDLEKDLEPPVISGVSDKQVTVGDTISYRSGVTAWDERDGQVDVTVDSSGVNLNAAGSYTVIYIAEDKAGNRATATATIEVLDITPERVMQLADELLAQITTPQMSNKEKCRAIYDWAQKKIKYVGNADMSDIYHGAYEGFTKKRGDCYTYYAVATVLFNQLGIPNMKVERAGGTSEHYWCLVNIGEGWYHFDCSPRRIGHYVDTCLVPDSVLEKYSTEEIEGYYNFDHSLYPERGQ